MQEAVAAAVASARAVAAAAAAGAVAAAAAEETQKDREELERKETKRKEQKRKEQKRKEQKRKELKRKELKRNEQLLKEMRLEMAKIVFDATTAINKVVQKSVEHLEAKKGSVAAQIQALASDLPRLVASRIEEIGETKWEELADAMGVDTDV